MTDELAYIMSQFFPNPNKHKYYDKTEKLLTYDEWLDIFEDDIFVIYAETGADREMDFDPEPDLEKRYQEYLDNQ